MLGCAVYRQGKEDGIPHCPQSHLHPNGVVEPRKHADNFSPNHHSVGALLVVLRALMASPHDFREPRGTHRAVKLPVRGQLQPHPILRTRALENGGGPVMTAPCLLDI